MLDVIKFSFKEIVSRKLVYLLLIINLMLGYLGFLGVHFFQDSLSRDLKSKSKNLLAADFSMTSSHRFSEEELKVAFDNIDYSQKTELIDFFGMIQYQNQTRLVNVRAFEDGYPLYGEITTDKDPLDYQQKGIWLDPEIKTQLNISDSETSVKLGDVEFKVKGFIKNDSTRFLRSSGLAPVVYISQKYLAETHLITTGSTLRHFVLFKLKDANLADQILKKMNVVVQDPTTKFETAELKAKDSQVTFKYFSDYLGLVALVALALGFLSAGYILQWMYQNQKKDLAIYQMLGMSHLKLRFLLLFKAVFISLIAYGLSLVICVVVQPLVQSLLVKWNINFQFQISFSSVAITFLITLIMPILTMGPLLQQIEQLNLKSIFFSGHLSLNSNSKFRTYLWYFIWGLAFWLLSVYQSKSFKTGSFFVLGLVSSILVFRLIIQIMIWLSEKVISRMNTSLSLGWRFEYILKALVRRKDSTVLIFVTLSSAFLILTLLPHIKKTIYAEIAPESTSVMPALFGFDIQSSQVEGTQKISEKNLNQSLEFIPMVRARILKINETDFSKLDRSDLTTREQDEEIRFRNRGVNISYQNELKPFEKIVEGKWNIIPAKNLPNELPSISLEKQYARRIGAKINDVMTFDVQGLEIKGKVTSLRQVRWTSFNPNFFIVFQPHVLEEAPKTFLTAVPNAENLNQFQTELVNEYPNVSIIDIRQTIKSLLGYIEQMSLALQAMSLLSLVLGCFIFYVILNTQIDERMYELNLLQVMGLKHESIQYLVGLQFLMIFLVSVQAPVKKGATITGITVS